MITLIYVLKYLFLPPTSLLIMTLIGLLNRKRKYGLFLVSVSLVLLLLLSLHIVVSQWALIWEGFSALQTAQVLPFNPQALVVFGGGTVNGALEYQSPVTINTRTLLGVHYAAKLARELDFQF